MENNKIFIILIFSLLLTACGAKENKADVPPQTEKQESTATVQETVSVESNTAEQDSQSDILATTPDTLSDIENYLLDKGLLSGERVRMGADLVGAIDGVKYKGSIGEIYEYSTDAEEYKKLLNGEEIALKGMESYKIKAVAINRNFVLLGDGVSQELIDAFNSFE